MESLSFPKEFYKRSKRSKSFFAAKAIAVYVKSQEWQLGEIDAGIAELESGQGVSHQKVVKWLKSWGFERSFSTKTVSRRVSTRHA